MMKSKLRLLAAMLAIMLPAMAAEPVLVGQPTPVQRCWMDARWTLDNFVGQGANGHVLFSAGSSRALWVRGHDMPIGEPAEACPWYTEDGMAGL